MKRLAICLIWFILFHGYLFADDKKLVAVDGTEKPFLELEVTARYLRNNRVSVLSDNDTITQKDGYALEFTSKEKAFVYIYQISDRVEELFPKKQYSKELNPVKPGKFYRIPNMGKWFYLDENKCREYLLVIANKEEVKNPEKLCRKLLRKQNTRGIGGTVEIKPEDIPTETAQSEEVPVCRTFRMENFFHS